MYSIEEPLQVKLFRSQSHITIKPYIPFKLHLTGSCGRIAISRGDWIVE